MAAEISNGLVSLHHEFYGKGPSKAKTYLVDDTVLCVLNEGFTTVERTLINGGDSGAVHDIRRSFQSAMKEQFTAVGENATGRSVTAYLSQIHTDPDVAGEIFPLQAPREALSGGDHPEYTAPQPDSAHADRARQPPA